jgi:tetratricopeptide (TPR) repeat protein
VGADRISPEDAGRLRAELRLRLAAEPIGGFRDWYRAQHELAEAGESDLRAALADDLWEILSERPEGGGDVEGRLWNNAGAFYGTPGPGASLERARSCFRRALDACGDDGEGRARALHNLGSALASLARSEDDLRGALAAFEEALDHRDATREIARAVTLHHLGIARRKLADRSPETAVEELPRSVAALEEALALRKRHGLARGAAATRFQLGISLLALGREAEGRAALEAAAGELEAAGQADQAHLARRLSGRGE